MLEQYKDMQENHIAYRYSSAMQRRILRDMRDGVIMISTDGTIAYINDSAADILGQAVSLLQRNPFAILIEDERNDDFNQFIVNAIQDKEHVHDGEVSYYASEREDTVKRLSLAVSFVNNDKGQREGIVAVITDITVLARVQLERKVGVFLFTFAISAVATFLVIWQIFAAFMKPPDWLMTRLIEMLSLIMFIFTKRFCSTITMQDIGLVPSSWPQLRTTLLRGVMIGIAVI
jgi:PAS domain S-box-containing protein